METKFNEGKEEAKIKMIKNGIKLGLSDENLAEMSEKPVEFVREIRKRLKQS